MLRRLLPVAAVLAAFWSSPLASQTPDWIIRIQAAADLPVSTAKARIEGTPSDEIRKILEIMLGAKVPADEACNVIDEERAARREHGPVDNFGAFIQSQLQAGLRGRELAAAIRSEHAAPGKGRMKTEGRGDGRGGDNRRAGQADGRGRGNAAASGAGEGGHEAQRSKGEAPGGRSAANDRKPNDKGKPANRPVKPNH
jgi:hypothetical protein